MENSIFYLISQRTICCLFPVAAVQGTDLQTWKNLGGQWMPTQLEDQANLLEDLSLQMDPANLANPESSALGAVVNLGVCSGSFVSSQGLVATNYHCVKGMLR